MSFNNFNSPVDHTSDAGYRTWGLQLFNEFDAINPGILTRTADTGQANWVTATRPGVNTYTQYGDWKLDEGGGITPLYIKLEVGTGPSATGPGWRLSVGTGTNGAGTLTGFVTTTLLCHVNSVPSSTVTNRASYISCDNGHLAIGWKVGATAQGGMCCFAIMRSVDPAAAITSVGVVVVGLNNPGSAGLAAAGRSISLTTGVQISNTTAAWCADYWDINTTITTGGNTTAWRWFGVFDNVTVPLVGAVTCLATEQGIGTQFTTIPVGVSAINYLALSGVHCSWSYGTSTQNRTLAIRWT